MKHNMTVVVAVLVAVAVTGCGGKKQKELDKAVKQAEAAAEQMEKATAPMIAQMERAANAAPVEPVDFRALKALLPEALPGLKRVEAAGEKTGAMGMTISMANARYSSDDGGSIRVKISDLGGMSGFAAMAQFGWAMQEVDRETETGYEKTIMIGGNKALEKYDRENKSGEIQIMVASRFMVEVDGRNVESTAIQTAVAKLPLDKLSALAK